jgi:hypothetical protein
MSEITYLMNDYKEVAAMSEKLNEAVMIFKKQNLISNSITKEKYPFLIISNEDLDSAKEQLLIHLNKVTDEEFISIQNSSAIKGINNKNLNEIKLKIGSGKILEKSDFDTLKILLNGVNHQRTVLFRKISSRR